MEKLIIPDSFFLEETRSGHLVTTETKKLWSVELEILNQFINICQKYAKMLIESQTYFVKKTS